MPRSNSRFVLLAALPFLACGSAPAPKAARSSDTPGPSASAPTTDATTTDVFKTLPADRCAALDASPWPREADERKTHKKQHIRMREEGATAIGPVGPKAAKQVIRMHLHELRTCYETAAKRDPTLKGSVALSFKITLAGRVRALSTACSTMESPEVASCLASIVLPLEFPPDELTETDVVYPLQFESWSDAVPPPPPPSAPVASVIAP